MRKLLLTAAAVIFFGIVKAEKPVEYVYDKDLIKAIHYIINQDTFTTELRKCTERKGYSGGAQIACLQSLIIEALKKEKNNFDELDAQSLAAEMWIASALQTMNIKRK